MNHTVEQIQNRITERLYLTLRSMYNRAEISAIGDTAEGHSEVRELWYAPATRALFEQFQIPIHRDVKTVWCDFDTVTEAHKRLMTVMIYGVTGRFLTVND